MSLLPPREPVSHSTPATKLKKKFDRVSVLEKSAKLADFNTLLKSRSYDEIDSLLTWLGKQTESQRSINSWQFTKQFDELLARKKNDLADYPVGEDAKAIATTVAKNAEYIEAEFIQHCMDEYSKLLQFLKTQPEPTAQVVYDLLPPAKDFALLWFTMLVPSYSKKFRKFELFHPKFQQFLLKLSGPTREIIAILNRYDHS